ncbi:MAG: mechanosensitive ion channel family protein [Acidimicrobiia bacterium]|jgi:small conductance mechanosensitive channel
MTISDEVWTQIWQTALIVVVGVVVWVLARWLIHRSSARLQNRLEATGELVDRAKAERLHTVGRTLSALVFIGAATVVVVTILGVWGVPLGPLIASLSVVGLAIGIGAQDLVKDVIAGIFVLVEDQYAIGDVVELAGVSGTVDEIRLRTTVLQDLDGSIHHVPNGEVRVSTNLTYEYSRVVVDLSVAYEESVDQALDAIGEVAAQLAGDAEWSPSIIDDPQVLGVDALDDSGVVIRVLFTTDPEMRWKVKREFLRRVKNGLDEAGIEIPYPHVTLTHRPDSG